MYKRCVTLAAFLRYRHNRSKVEHILVMTLKKSLIILAISIILLVIFLTMTDPLRLPLVFLIAPFLLIAIISYQSLRLITRRAGLSQARTRVIAISVTTLILLIALLQSIRQLSVKDFLILAALTCGITFYLRR